MQVIDAETYYPSAFVNILHRCLSFNPTDRPSMREVVQQLLEVCLLFLDITDMYSMPPTCAQNPEGHVLRARSCPQRPHLHALNWMTTRTIL